jgi:hypothetical protein
VLDGDFREKWDELKDVDLDVTIKKYRKKRSHNANSYLWFLCEEIAKNQGITKEEVYRKQIREVGVYEPLPVREDAIERFDAAWRQKGIGWFTEVVDDSFPGYKKIFAYYGTSVYNTEEMSRVINAAVEDARALGIDLISPEEMSLLMEEWDEKHRAE